MYQSALVFFAFCFVYSVSHIHNNKAGSKESVEHGSYIPREDNHFKHGKHAREFDHESILGGHSAAAEFENLPPEEAKKRLFTLALKMDSNGDKYVDRTELINWVLKSFILSTKEDALEDFEEKDENKDGKISWDEIVSGQYRFLNFDLDDPSDRMLEDNKEEFNAADLNGDGILEKSEYVSYYSPIEFEHMHQVLYEQTMRKQDTNKDGSLSFEEFMVDNYAYPPLNTTEHYALEKDRFMNDFDLNGDKKLSKDEVLLWLIPNNVDTAETEADNLIENSDTDKDGKLSIEEIVDNYDFFVDSEATNFGEHLQNQRYIDEL